MYVYIRTEPRLWTAGFYKPDGEWEPDSDHGSQQDAAWRAAALNGAPDTRELREVLAEADAAPAGSRGEIVKLLDLKDAVRSYLGRTP
jgi:hypothetical protein